MDQSGISWASCFQTCYFNQPTQKKKKDTGKQFTSKMNQRPAANLHV